MRATVMYGAGDVRVENVPDATLVEPTDALLRVTRACICGSDLWPFNQMPETDARPAHGPRVHRRDRGVGADVRTLKVGDLVVAPFAWSDGTCVFCQEGLQTACLHGGFWGGDLDGGQGEAVRVPLADGTLVPLPVGEDDALMPSLLTLSDVMGTGHHAALAARVRPVNRRRRRRRCGRPLRRDRREAPRRRADHHPRPPCRPHRAGEGLRRDRRRQRARRGGGRARQGADRRPRRAVGARVRRPRPVDGDGAEHRASRRRRRTGGRAAGGVDPLSQPTFFENITISGGPAPARAYIEELLPDVLEGRIEPGRVFDRTGSLDEVPDGYRAMNERESIKVMIEL